MAGPCLTARQRDILRAVVRDYVLTVEPVGSRTLSKKYDLGLSAATIRNELADLEDEGLLCQPHTSAGRIPSQFGYRVFVDDLLEAPRLSASQQCLVDQLSTETLDLVELLQQMARLIAAIAGCTALVRVPRQNGSRIRTLSLVGVNDHEALLVLVTSTGTVLNKSVHFCSPIGDDELQFLSNFLGAKLRNCPLDDLTGEVLNQVSREMDRYRSALEQLSGTLATIREAQDRVVVSNAALLVQQPEFRSTLKVGNLLEFLEKEAALAAAMDASIDVEFEPGTVQVRIGSENAWPDLAECSLVSAAYLVGDRIAGEVAVLGPTRLDYAVAMAAVQSVAHRLSQALTRRLG